MEAVMPEFSLMPEIASFLASHPEFGNPVGTFDVPNWARGKRQRVYFNNGNDLLFYEKDGEVITVWQGGPGVERKVVWGDTEG